MFLYTSLVALVVGCPQLSSDDFRLRRGDVPGGLDVRDAGAADEGDRRDAGDAGESHADASAGPDGLPDGTPPTPVDALRAALAQRYSFEGTGQDAIDSSGGVKGWIYNATLAGQGFLRLTGNDDYASLPNALLSSGNDRTIEVWLIWRGGGPWQRIFDFGSSNAGELAQGLGTSYLFLTSNTDSGVMRVTYSRSGLDGEVSLNGHELPTDTLVQVAVAVNSAESTLSLYVDGVLDGTVALDQPLSSIVDNNAWIGRSQFVEDPGLIADVLDVRIYSRALDADQVALSFELGADSPLTNPPE